MTPLSPRVRSCHSIQLLIYPHPFLWGTPSVLGQELLQLTQLPRKRSPTDRVKHGPCKEERSHRSDGWQQVLLLIWDRRTGRDVPPWKGCCLPRGRERAEHSKGTKPGDRHVLPFGRGAGRAGGL